MESLSKLHYADEVFKKILIVHNMTKIKRREVKKLVEEAKEWEKQEGQYKFKVCGSPGNMKIVKSKNIKG